jgi:hypothetical protein
MAKLRVELVVTAPDGHRIELFKRDGLTITQLERAGAITLPRWLKTELLGWRERYKGDLEITG